MACASYPSHWQWTDFTDECVRWTWAALVPTSYLTIILLAPFILRLSQNVLPRSFCAAFNKYLTIHEAEILEKDASANGYVPDDLRTTGTTRRWKTFTICFLGIAQTLSWVGIGSYTLLTSPSDAFAPTGAGSYLISLTCLYTAVYPALYPISTSPLNLFVVYFAHTFGAILTLGGLVYDQVISGLNRGLVIWTASVCNLLVVCVLLAIVLSLPIGTPGEGFDKDEIGKTLTPEYYCSLGGWITFHWIYPMLRLGRYTTLQDADVWELSPTMKSSFLFLGFSKTKRSTLLKRLWACNSYDLILSFIFTYVSISFYYTGPYFLRNILDAIDSKNPTPESRAKAYIYAVLAFVCATGKTAADCHHMYFSRRACTRIRSELMAAIYDKALKRKDFSGTVAEQDALKGEDGPIPTSGKLGKEQKKASADIGKIVNLMSGDSSRISQSCASLTVLYGAPFEILIGGTYLYKLLGPSAFAGFALLIACWPLNSYVSRRAIGIKRGLTTARDKRMSIVNELFGAIKFVKFFAWEDKWIERVMNEREAEVGWMIRSRYNDVLFSLIWTLSPILVSIVTFFVYVATGNQLTVSIAFTSLALFELIRSPLNVIPMKVMELVQTKVSLDRISAFLEEEEVTEQVSSLKRGDPVDHGDGVESASGLGLKNADFRWNEAKGSSSDNRTGTNNTTLNDDNQKFELKDISVMFPEGRLTIVTGPTASGKSALLMALLGEMELVSGTIMLSKQPTKLSPGSNGLTQSVSYAAQSPWLRHQSIKDNILFCSEWDKERYEAVIRCCALRPDLELLEDGDETEIGARGVNLSGGQKARVALARAVYARTQYVLLDDPLSAVDSHTARFLSENLFCGSLLNGRTVVLVTHHVELILPAAHYIVRMENGCIDNQGAVQDLRTQGALDNVKRVSIAQAVAKEQPNDLPLDQPEDDPAPVKKPRRLVKDEHREVGGVKWSVYKTYLKTSSFYVWYFLAALLVLSQCTMIFEKYWIKRWGEAYDQAYDTSTSIYGSSSFVTQQYLSYSSIPYRTQAENNKRSDRGIDLPDANQQPLFYVGIYALIGVMTAVFTMLSVIMQYYGGIRASRRLFQRLLVRVTRATMRWYDITPQGRLLNRFGKDIETIDDSLASNLQNANAELATFFASVITIIVILPGFLIAAIVIGLISYELAVAHVNTSRDLRRMESNTISPIFSDFEETVAGIVTIRAFSAEARFLSSIHKNIDTTTKMWYVFWMTKRWLLLNFDLLGNLSVMVTTFFALSGYVSAGIAGLCIASAMSFTLSVYWTCNFWNMLELDLNSVERVVEYLDLPQEPAAVIESRRPPAYWPSAAGARPVISVENLMVKYAPELPPVLQGVSFSLSGGERIGVLGRTGSGKSTLAMSILRFVDPVDGRIVIDGIDISTIGLYDLRSRITFIPQDATLFSGTIRQNLDPFGRSICSFVVTVFLMAFLDEHDDATCLGVLRRAHLIDDSSSDASQLTSREASTTSSALNVEQEQSDAFSTCKSSNYPDLGSGKVKITLDSLVSAGGTNFSQGQRQLIAMARALLRRSSIVVLDEATSSIDFQTDVKIQATIRAEFGNSLLITVAHRLRMVIDYDRLIVLDKGQIVELDTPYKLIRKEGGVFRRMCLSSGTFAELETAAKIKSEKG